MGRERGQNGGGGDSITLDGPSLPLSEKRTYPPFILVLNCVANRLQPCQHVVFCCIVCDCTPVTCSGCQCTCMLHVMLWLMTCLIAGGYCVAPCNVEEAKSPVIWLSVCCLCAVLLQPWSLPWLSWCCSQQSAVFTHRLSWIRCTVLGGDV